MSFVKLDCRTIHSSLWDDADGRVVFLTALMMCVTFEAREPLPEIDSEDRETGFVVPVGFYGLVDASGIGIIRAAQPLAGDGWAALERLRLPEKGGKGAEHEGRRLVRTKVGYIVLNLYKYRDRDKTGAKRQADYRLRLRAKLGRGAGEKAPVPGVSVTPLRDVSETLVSRESITKVTRTEDRGESKEEKNIGAPPPEGLSGVSGLPTLVVDVTEAPQPASTPPEPDRPKNPRGKRWNGGEPAGFRRWWDAWPDNAMRKIARDKCLSAWRSNNLEPIADKIVSAVEASKLCDQWQRDGGQFMPNTTTWLNQRRWEAGPPKNGGSDMHWD